MGGLSISLLGPFRASLDGSALDHFHTRRVQALLIYLAVTRPSSAGQREKLMEFLWPGLPPRSAQINLRQTIYHLRKTVPPILIENGSIDFLESDRHRVLINSLYPLQVDVTDFEFKLDTVWKHGHPNLLDCPSCKAQLEEAANLYRGDFLADFYLEDSKEFEEWSTVTRETMRRRLLDALDTLVEIHIHRKDYRQGRVFAERQLQIDNLRESAYRQLMTVLALSGQRAAAVGAYEQCVKRLADELGTAPTARTAELHARILAEDLSLRDSASSEVNGYELIQKIGSRSSGSVYRAKQVSVGRDVAIKIIPPGLASRPEFIRRFESEAHLVARLEHPHIAPLFDFWRDPEGAYLVMRYFRSGSLADALGPKPYSVKAAALLLDQIASALSLAHRNNIAHLDLKPSNILLDEDGNAYLSDFGIAKDTEFDLEVLITTGDIHGTVNYLAPEQVQGEPATARTDIYSLGITLYEMLVGNHPFSGRTPAEVLNKHINEPLPPLTNLDTETIDTVNRVLQQATAKNPFDRFHDTYAMASAFRAAITLDGSDGRGYQGTRKSESIYPKSDPDPVEVNPYKGLRAFQEEDADDFFGREALVDRLVARLSKDRFLAVVGPSGSGKSSVVGSGLIPALRAGACPGSEKWFIVRMTVGSHPVEELEKALLPVSVNPPPSLVEPMLKDRFGLVRTLKRILPDETDPQILLVIDQFEELYTLVTNKKLREHFIDILLTALEAPSASLRLLITLRADFYDRPLQSQPLGKLLQWHSELVLPLSPDELERAVQNPAARVGVRLEAGLMTAISADVSAQPGVLPLLQYALTELFEARRSNTMTLSDYIGMGRLTGALGRRAEALLEALDPDSQAVARQIFLRLVTLGEGIEDTRRRVPRAELEALVVARGETDTLEWVTDTFGRHRLLTFDRDPLTRGPTVEVAHEALLREWSRMRQWLESSREDIRFQRRLAEAVADWENAGQNDGFLLQGSRLDQFAEWAALTSLALTPNERIFLELSLASRQKRLDEEEARRTREIETAQRLAEIEKTRAEDHARDAGRLRRQATFLAAALFVAAILALVALNFGRSAAASADLAATRQLEAQGNAELAAIRESDALRSARLASARELAAAAIANINVDPERSILLALRAVMVTYSVDRTVLPEAENALHQSVQASRVQFTLSGHKGPVTSIAFSPDGKLLATASVDKMVIVWDSSTGLVLNSLAGHLAPVNDVAFSTDGTRLASASSDGTVKVWNVANGQELLTLDAHQAPVLAISFSPDSTRLAAGSENGSIIFWNVFSGNEVLTLSGHSAAVVGIAFSPDGDRLVTGSQDKTAIVWAVESGERLYSITGHKIIVQGVAFSPDGERLTTSSWDSTVKIWNARSAVELYQLTSHTNAVPDVAYTIDGKLLATASLDTTAKVWDASSGHELLTLSGHLGAVTSVAFSPDGVRLATASADGTAKIWDITPSRELLTFSGHDDWILRIALSPDGSRLVTASLDGTVKIWDVTSGEVQMILREFKGRVHSAVFSPDGTLIATASEDGIRILDAQDGALLRHIPGPTEGMLSGTFKGTMNVAFNPDGNLLAAAGADSTAVIWDVTTGALVFTLTGHGGGLFDIAYSPDGQYIATASDDATARIWEATTGRELFTLSGHTSFVWSVAFSSDGRYLVTTGRDGRAKVWDAVTFKEIITLSGHAGTIFDGVFSPDNTLLVTSSGDGTARVWDLTTGQERLVFSDHTKLVSTAVFSLDGNLLLTSGMDGMVRVHVLQIEDLIALALSRLTRTWRPEECLNFLRSTECPSGP